MTTTASQAAGTRRPLLRLLHLARPMRGRLLVAALAGAAATGSGVALLAVSGFLLARASEHPNIVAISIAVVAVRALGISRGVFRYAERLSSHDVAFRVLADVRVAIYRRLERLAPAGLAVFRSGDLLARLISDVDSTQDVFIRGIVPPLAAALVGAGAVLASVALLVPAGLALCAGLLAGGAMVPAIAAASARKAGDLTAPARGEFGAVMTDMLAGAAELHAFGAQDEALAQLTTADRQITRLAERSAAGSGLGTGLSAAVAGGTLWGVLLLGVAATGAGTIGRVPLAVLALTALAAFEAVNVLPSAALQLGQARGAARRVTAVLDAPDPVHDPASPIRPPAGPVRVRLRAASVRYRPGEPPALDGVDLDLSVGRRIALVGPSGAGKSTVAAVLLRFCDLTSGSVTLNGQDLARFAADDVRALIGGCPQDPHIFDTTIKANLLLAGPDADDAALAEAAARAGLLTWIESLPAGWETLVGAHGARLSGGQRQRLALARAFLADPGLLVLDEPTAHLDADSRRALMTDLLAATQGHGMLLITHALEGLDQLDEIVVLEHGRVVERGSHDQLASADSRYRQMLLASPSLSSRRSGS